MGLLVPLLSSVVALGVFLVLHLLIEPRKERRRVALEKLEKLYGPLYALIAARYFVAGRFRKEVTLGSIKDHEFLTKRYMDQFFLNNSGYASPKLIAIWSQYASGDMVDLETIHELIRTIVKEYNHLRKSLKLEYDEGAMATGRPDYIAHEDFR